jgi:hypothetical protein
MALYVHVCKQETLQEAYRLAKQNNGAPGVTAHLGERYRAKSGGEVSGRSEGAGVLQMAAVHATIK